MDQLPVPSASVSATGHEQALAEFWERQKAEVEQVGSFKTHPFPVGRIRKIMMTAEEGFARPVPGEVPALLSKACEMFAKELTLRAWVRTEGSGRRVLQREDLVAAVVRHDAFGFLLDVLPEDAVAREAVPGPLEEVPPLRGVHLFSILVAGDLRGGGGEPKEDQE